MIGVFTILRISTHDPNVLTSGRWLMKTPGEVLIVVLTPMPVAHPMRIC